MKMKTKENRFLGSWEAVFLVFITGNSILNFFSQNFMWGLSLNNLIACIVLTINFLSRRK